MRQEKFEIQNLLLVITLMALFFPFISLASGKYTADGSTICYEGLVPCGKAVQEGGTLEKGKCVGGTAVTIPCQLCHFLVMLEGIINFAMALVIIIAVLMFTVGGFMFLVAAGNPGTVNQAREIIRTVAIGLAIIFLSWIAVNTVFTFIGVADWTGLKGGWFQIKCPIKIDPTKETLNFYQIDYPGL